MKAFGIGTIEKTEENLRWFERDGYKMTGETLKLGYDDRQTEYVVFKGNWTRSESVRDCGDHYIYAGYADYFRIDKKTLGVTISEYDA